MEEIKLLGIIAAVLMVLVIVPVLVFYQPAWPWVMGLGALLSVVFAVLVFIRIKKDNEKIQTAIEDYRKKRNEYRKKKIEYDDLREKYLLARRLLSKYRKEKIEKSEYHYEESEDYQKLLRKYESAKKEMVDKDQQLDKEDREGLKTAKKNIFEAETAIVNKGYIPFAWLVALLIIFSSLLFASLADASVLGNQSGASQVNQIRYFGTFSLLCLGLLPCIFLLYIFVSRRKVGETEQGVKFFLGKPYQLVSRGPCYVPVGLGSLLTLPLGLQYYDMYEVKVNLTGEEAQSIYVDASVPYHFSNNLDVITELGTSYVAIKVQLEGPSPKAQAMKGETSAEAKKEQAEGNIISTKVEEVIRAFIGSVITSLDEALQMRDDLALELAQILREDLEYLGIRFSNVVINDVRPETDMQNERNKRSVSAVKVVTATNEASAKIAEAHGKAESTKKTGGADAEVIKLKGTSEAEVLKSKLLSNAAGIKAELEAKIESLKMLGENSEALKARAILTTLLLGEKPIAEAMKALAGMKLNVFAVKDVIDDIIGLLGGGGDKNGKK